MTLKIDGERLAAVEVEMKNIDNRIEGLTKSVEALHGKFDALTMVLSNNYVAKETFEEYKKSRNLDRVIVALITAIISGVLGFILRENGV